MEMQPDIILFRVPFCGKCAAVSKTLREINAEIPELAIKELSLATNLLLAHKYGLFSVPSLLIRGKPLRGLVSKQQILEALE